MKTTAMNVGQTKKLSFLDLVWEYKISLAFYIVGISFLTFVVLYAFGGVPDELKVINTQAVVVNTVSQPSTPARANQNLSGELPVHITISKIGVDAAISNPASSDNDTLNNYLLKGAVRYPGSGTLGLGNMFLFGHSTGIRIVNNQAYKTFNHIKDLNIDDIVKIQSSKKIYTYKVTSVRLVDSDAALVDLSTLRNMVTLSTCDVFGEKQQRFVVEADYVSSSVL